MDGRSNAVSGGKSSDLYNRVDFPTDNLREFTAPVNLSDKEFLLTSANIASSNSLATSYGTVCLKGTGITDVVELVFNERGRYEGRNFTGQVTASGSKTTFTLEAWLASAGDLILFYKEL